MIKKIVVDAGHGGADLGAVNGLFVEKDMNLVTALALREKAVKYGFDVIMTRETDFTLDINSRCRMANNLGADLFVSCHYNAGGGDRSEVIHSIYYGAGTQISKVINAHLKKIGQTEMRNISKANSTGTADYFGVIRDTKMTAVIIEPCFIDNIDDRQIADTMQEQQDIGYKIADAIAEFCGKAVVGNEPIAPAPAPHWGKPYIDNLIRMGIISEDKDPNANVSWAELAKVTCEVIKLL